MKEHGLIYGAVSMLGIIDGSKTMTRRVVAYHNSTINGPTCERAIWDELDFDAAFVDNGPSPAGNEGPYLRVAFPKTDGFQGLPRHDCQYRVYPRVQVGDAIRCKEGWRPVVENARVCQDPDITIEYKADGAVIVVPLPDGARCPVARFSLKTGEQMWSSPAFMPRWASRAFLPVTELVAQRVQDIEPEDVYHEGIKPNWDLCPEFIDEDAMDRFIKHWDTINAKRGHPWSRNDWAWGYKWKEATR